MLVDLPRRLPIDGSRGPVGAPRAAPLEGSRSLVRCHSRRVLVWRGSSSRVRLEYCDPGRHPPGDSVETASCAELDCGLKTGFVSGAWEEEWSGVMGSDKQITLIFTAHLVGRGMIH